MLMSLRWLVVALCVLVVPVSQASAQVAPQSASPAVVPAAQAPSSAYILGPGDVVEVEVLGQSDFGKARVKIQPDGTIPLPVLGTVQAGGRTVQQLASLIQQKLIQAQYYNNPTVNVDIASYASRYVIVLGDVAQPGLVPIDRPYRVSEILARVGGLKDNAAEYIVLSSVSGQERHIPIASLSRNGPANDPYVNPDDKLYVPDAQLFYIYGQVNAPGSYPLKAGMTVRQALARGGGLTPSGSEGRVSVYRNQRKIKVPLDTPLAPGDVLVVGERLF
jgi:polysaccharide export outer membrane protein